MLCLLFLAAGLLTKSAAGYNLQEGEVVELFDERLALMARSNAGFLMDSVSNDNGLHWSTDIQSTELPSVMCAFNTISDPSTQKIFVFLTYDDPLEFPDMAQKPQERASLARSVDHMKSWDFLCDIDDFEGGSLRFMNLGMFLTDRHIYTMVSVFGTKIGKNISRAALQVTRLERSRLTPYAEFPTLH